MKQWDMQHIGIFDINFDTGEHYWSAELRASCECRNGMPPEFLILLQHVHPDDRQALSPSRWSLCKEVRATPLLRASSARSRWHCGLRAHRGRHIFFVLAANATAVRCNRTSHGESRDRERRQQR